MVRDWGSERKAEQVREGDRSPAATSKVRAESTTAEDQAQPRTKFSTFSGGTDQMLVAARRGETAEEHRARQNAAVEAGKAVGQRVSEFVIEDRGHGVEYTAGGARSASTPVRFSFSEGLRKIVAAARTEEEAAELQGKFSITYMMRKMQEFVGAAQEALAQRPSVQTFAAPNSALVDTSNSESHSRAQASLGNFFTDTSGGTPADATKGVRKNYVEAAEVPSIPASNLMSDARDSSESEGGSDGMLIALNPAEQQPTTELQPKSGYDQVRSNWQGMGVVRMAGLKQLNLHEAQQKWLHVFGRDDDQRHIGEAHALLYVLREMMLKPDHATGAVEYNALLGSNKIEGVKVSEVKGAQLDTTDEKDRDKSLTQPGMEQIKWQVMGVDGYIIVHSHPISYVGDQMRAWKLLSREDMKAVHDLSKQGAKDAVAYILGPDGSVLQWREGDKTIWDDSKPPKLFGEPRTVGKFTKEGDYIPYKSLNGKAVPDEMHKVSSAQIASWTRENHWLITDRETGGL